MTPTDADLKRAYELTADARGNYDAGVVAHVAAALAEEREKARAPFLALADEITEAAASDDAQAMRLEEWGFPDSGETNRTNAREKQFYADRICRAAEVTE